jgi:hypothetical protein
MGNWEALVAKGTGLTPTMGQVVVAAGPMPEFLGPCIFVGSDYSGSHAGSSYDVYAMLLLDSLGCRQLIDARRDVRAFLGGRRMSYKGLNDGLKRRVLIPFLASADRIRGLCVAVAVSKSAGSLFQGNTEGVSPEFFPCLEWGKPLFERALRVVHFVSFFIAGVTSENQDVLWFTDEDEIAANDQRLTLLTNVWANVLSHYVVHNLRHLRCGTTKCDDGSNQIEDPTVLPDLVAGAVSDLLTSVEGRVRHGIITPFPLQPKPKATVLGQWLSRTGGNLRKLILKIEKEPDSERLTVASMKFWDVSDARSIRL